MFSVPPPKKQEVWLIFNCFLLTILNIYIKGNKCCNLMLIWHRDQVVWNLSRFSLWSFNFHNFKSIHNPIYVQGGNLFMPRIIVGYIWCQTCNVSRNNQIPFHRKKWHQITFNIIEFVKIKFGLLWSESTICNIKCGIFQSVPLCWSCKNYICEGSQHFYIFQIT